MTVLLRVILVVACGAAALLSPSAALAQTGEIRGLVTHKHSGAPLADIRVSAYTEDGTLVAQAFTNVNGEYALGALTPRFYYLSAGKTLLEFLPETWGCGHGCAVVDSTPVPVSPGAITDGINFSLEPPAGISGTVTSGVTGLPVAFRTVRLTPVDGRSAASAWTDASGVYTLDQLPSGTYYVTTEGVPGLVDERYPDVPCDPTCAPAAGTPVALVAGQVTTGVDFTLAGDAPTGLIAGVVRNASTLAPLSSAPVSAFNTSGQFVAQASTNAQGEYNIAVPPGTYSVRTSLGPYYPHYQDELFAEIPCATNCPLAAGTPVPVTSGATTSGIDFTVTPAGSIAGVVTAAGGGPLGGVPVNILTTLGAMVATTVTNGGGAYSLVVPPGTYFVETAIGTGGAYADERYDGGDCAPVCGPSVGTPVVVAAGAATTGINFALAPTWMLTGTVTSEVTLAPLVGVYVQIFTAQGQWLRTLSPTGPSGTYMDRLRAGTYYVRTVATSPGVADEVFNNVPCPAACDVTTGTPVVITAGVTTVADFALSPAGTLSGQVRHAGTAAAVSAHVDARTADGTVVATTVTEPDGSYVLTVPAGSYRVVASPAAGANVVAEVYNDIPCPYTCPSTTGVPVAVAAGQSTAHINFGLAPGGTINGFVTDAATGGGLTGVQVVAHLPDGTPVSSMTTSLWGGFSIPAAPGTYFLRTRVPTAKNYIDELYGGKPCAPECFVPSGTPVIVSADVVTSDINFALDSGGMLSGRVIAAGSLAGIATIQMELSTDTGAVVGTTLTNASGHFTFGGLATGSYRLRTTNGWGQGWTDVLYANVPCAGCAATLGTPIDVTAGQATTGVTITLTPGGAFAGIVRDSNGGALTSIPIHAYRADGGFVRTVFSGIDGHFTVEGLPSGTYFARTGSEHYANVWHGGVACGGSCTTPQGVPIVVAAPAVTPGIDFALTVGGTLAGRVVDAITTQPIPAGAGDLRVEIFSLDGVRLHTADVDAAGRYAFTGLAAGSYRVRTANRLGYIDEQFDNVVCLMSCEPAAGTAVAVTAGATTADIDFALSPGGRIAGAVTDALSSAPIAGVVVRVHAADGTWVASAFTGAAGTYTIAEGLPSGTYYARTFSASGYLDQIHSGLTACLPGCLPTEGTPIVVTAGSTASGVNFALTPGTELIQNGGFTYGTAHWMAYATPSMAYMPWRVSSGSFEFGRVPPPPGDANQAVVFQNTGAPVQPGATLVAQFDLGNTSPVRKRISVVVHDADFGDLSVCTFWLPPQLPLTRYALRTRTTRLWTNATISFYAASTNVPAGDYQIDNVSMQTPASVLIERTDCVEPAPPAFGGGGNGPDLLVNGDFSSGAIAPGWTTYGQITSQVSNGVFEFVRPAGTPAGVLLQATGQAVPARTPLTATFQLGNTSATRKRVTVIVHDNDFSDLSACTFWLAPGQPLLPYTYRTFTTRPWTNATLSVYPATVGLDEWIQFDNATLRATPGDAMAGVACIEPDGGSWGSGHDAVAAQDSPAADRGTSGLAALATSPDAVPGQQPLTADAAGGVPAIHPEDDALPANAGWIADGFSWTGEGWVATAAALDHATLRRAAPLDLTTATSARLTFASWLTGVDARARVEVSLDGDTWLVAHIVETSDTWVPVEVDLTAWLGTPIHVRLVLDPAPTAGPPTAPVWQVRDVGSVESGP